MTDEYPSDQGTPFEEGTTPVPEQQSEAHLVARPLSGAVDDSARAERAPRRPAPESYVDPEADASEGTAAGLWMCLLAQIFGLLSVVTCLPGPVGVVLGIMGTRRGWPVLGTISALMALLFWMAGIVLMIWLFGAAAGKAVSEISTM